MVLPDPSAAEDSTKVELRRIARWKQRVTVPLGQDRKSVV